MFGRLFETARGHEGASELPAGLRLEVLKQNNELYFVGSLAASCHLIDTGDGLILIDTGFPQTLYLLIDSIHRVGFDPREIRYILHTHGHYDHLGGTKQLVEMTGAKTFLGAPDAPYAYCIFPLPLSPPLFPSFFPSSSSSPLSFPSLSFLSLPLSPPLFLPSSSLLPSSF